MSVTPRFRGTVTDKGLFKPDDARYYGALARYRGKPLYIVLEGEAKKRSNQENRYYRGCVLPILAEAYGVITADEMHGVLQPIFWSVTDDRGNLRIKSTTEYSTVEFEEKMAQIRTWASVELGAYVPLPNEISY
jgi:hypothetical protein